MKKIVCVLSNTETTCSFIARQLLRFLNEYVDVKTWCLERAKETPMPCGEGDIYIVSHRTVLESVHLNLPQGKPVLLAARTINIENLDKLLKLEAGTQAIVVGTTEQTAAMVINMINNLGIRYLVLRPYYPGSPEPVPAGITTAITTGLSHLVPPEIKKIVDLGGNGLDLSTFADLIKYLDAPLTVLNDISHYYIESILNISLKSENIARHNEILKRNLEVILDTVDEAIIAVNERNEVVVFNPAAERLLGIKSSEAVDLCLRDVLPQVDFSSCLTTGESIIHDIKAIKENNYVISANPITNQAGAINGVVAIFRPVGEVQELETKVRRVLRNKGYIAKYTFADIIGESEEFRKSVSLAKKFASSELTILLEGESGTGKELIAQAIHNSSPRRNGPFVALNFAALPENLVESELFGYEDGAFTGARKGGKPGLFEEAHQGTIFLDEIGDAPLDVQKKLLRVLEEREVRRVGGNIMTPINVRVIAATNQKLEELVDQGQFRMDLLYRLCTVPIQIPPLRSRPGDILLLCRYFMRKFFNRELSFDSDLSDFLTRYDWPGNIREVQNVIRFICTTASEQKTATLKDLPAYLFRKVQSAKTVKVDGQKKEGLQDKTGFKTNLEGKYQLLVQELQNRDALEAVITILNEMHQSSSVNRAIGRHTLVKRLWAKNKTIPDHKVRSWLKLLQDMGFIHSGITRQGSRITKLGQELLSFVEKNAGMMS